MTLEDELLEKLNRAVVTNRLVVVTGAGVSNKIKTDTGEDVSLPSWGELSKELERRTRNVIPTNKSGLFPKQY